MRALLWLALTGPCFDNSPGDPCSDCSSEQHIAWLYLQNSSDRISSRHKPDNKADDETENCTHILLTHIPVVFVTWVLKTPCTLISAPEIRAMIKPVISGHSSFPFEKVVSPKHRFLFTIPGSRRGSGSVHPLLFP